MLGVAHHSETFEEMVAYRRPEPGQMQGLWVRPLEMFQDQEIIERDGKKVPRFRYIGK